ncbi:MAG: AAA family ATPase, partial [Candidatus Aenigmatarchaeota archaeon]
MIKRELVEDFFSREIEFEGIERELKIKEVRKIISITGPRRAGKTWYFYSLAKKLRNPLYVNFEDIAFRDLSIEEFFDIIKIFTELKYKPENLLLDEVQTIKNWQILTRSLYDRGYKIFITG